MKKMIIYGIVLLMPAASCKKDKSPGIDNKKIASAVKNNTSFVFSYDAQNRLQRVDFGVGFYTLVEYQPAGIIIQQYDAAGNPQANSRIEYNVVGGKIASGKTYKGNGLVVNHYYEYDNEGRLTKHIAREVKTLNNNEEGYRVQFSYNYDGSGNVSKATYLSFYQGERQDSIVNTRTYHTNKSFYTWQNLGIGFMGTAGTGMQHQGLGISSPGFYLFPFFSYPSANAPKENTEDNYTWSTAQNKYVFQNTSRYEIPESAYQYNEAGNLIASDDVTKIEWK